MLYPDPSFVAPPQLVEGTCPKLSAQGFGASHFSLNPDSLCELGKYFIIIIIILFFLVSVPHLEIMELLTLPSPFAVCV